MFTHHHQELGLDRPVSASSIDSSKVFRIIFVYLVYNSAWGSEVRSETSPRLPEVQPALINEALGADSQRCNCSRGGNAAEHACPEAERWQPHHWST